jgi:hypothetical protein
LDISSKPPNRLKINQKGKSAKTGGVNLRRFQFPLSAFRFHPIIRKHSGQIPLSAFQRFRFQVSAFFPTPTAPRLSFPHCFQVDMIELGPVQALAPVLPPMARARSASVVPGIRLGSIIRRACVGTPASTHVLPPSVLSYT